MIGPNIVGINVALYSIDSETIVSCWPEEKCWEDEFFKTNMMGKE